MSQNNSKNRISKFSNTAPTDIPPSRNDLYNQPYPNSFKPQAPSVQPPENLQNLNPSSYSKNMTQSYSDRFPVTKTSNGKNTDQPNFSNNTMNYNYYPFYGQPQMGPQTFQQMPPGQKIQTPFEMQQGQYGFYNMNQQGGFQAPFGFQYIQADQNFSGVVNNPGVNQSQMIEEKIINPQDVTKRTIFCSN